MLTSELMQRAGFSAPPLLWTKDDPRGGDYGHYEASVPDPGPGMIKVKYVCADDAEHDFTMYFKSAGDFIKWAKC